MLRRTAAETRRLLIEMAASQARRSGRRAHRHRRRRARASPIRRSASTYAELIGGRYFDSKVKWNGRLGNGLQVEVAGAAEEAHRVQGHRQVAAAPRPARQGLRHARNGQRRAAARHAARPHDPSDGCRRGAGEGRRSVDQAHPGRQGRVDQGSARGRRREGMERGQGGAGAEGHLVGVEAELPRPREAARAHPQGADRQARVPAPERQLRGGHQAGRPRHRGRVRIPDPVAFEHWARPARSPTCATARRRSGPRPRSPTIRAACVAELLGMPTEKVRAIWMFGTGSYGRNEQGDATADAAVLSKHLGRAGARAVHAPRGHRLGPEGHGFDQSQPRRASTPPAR